MMLKRVAVLSLIVTATTCWAQIVGDNVPAGLGQINVPVDEIAGVIPRTPLPKRPVVNKPVADAKLIVKFRDDLRFRANPKGDTAVLSAVGADTTLIDEIAANHNVHFVPAVKLPQERLTALQNRAALFSGKGQPDLGGMMYVEGLPQDVEAAAAELHALDLTEFVYFQAPWTYSYGGGTGACCVTTGEGGDPPLTVQCIIVDEAFCDDVAGNFQGVGTACPDPDCDPTLGACCIDDQTCDHVTEAVCLTIGGSFKGIGTNCELDEIDCQNQGCGSPENGSCFEVHLNPYCDDEPCCDAVGDLDPFCVLPPEEGGTWDQICVWIANLICDAGDRCAAGGAAGDCFDVHQAPGCVDSGCCNLVCGVDTFCCENFWDLICVDIAVDLCNDPTAGGPTPDFVANQGYLRASSYFDQPAPAPPPGLALPAPDTAGYGGEGYDLFDANVLEDDPDGLTGAARYKGVYGLGRELAEVYGVGTENRARGKGVKVAVLEWCWFTAEPFEDLNGNNDFDAGEPFVDYNQDGDRDSGHEDLDVKDEPGQTQILTEDLVPPFLGLDAPAHATACLGIIGAKPNGFGVTGIAPDAELLFFPLTSVEEGPRTFAAFASCYETLDPGDVVSCSFGGGGNLNTNEGTWMLIRLGTDLGITTCVAAGNDCANLDDVAAGNLGDSGAIVVGACSPGAPFCRLAFSNYVNEATDDGDSRTIHISAWGDGVATAGGRGPFLFFPGGNRNRSYTADFGGTSAACPQVAGLVACLSGLAQQFYGIPIAPTQHRLLITGAPVRAWYQCGTPTPFGFDEAFGCGLDVDPEEEPNRIGGYTKAREASTSMLSQEFGGFDASPLIDDIFVIRGNLLFGNKFSIKASDNSYLLLHSLYTERKFAPPFAGPPGEVTYLADGHVTDLMVVATSDVKEANGMQIQVEVQPPPEFTLLVVEMYDWVLNDWSFVGFDAIPGGIGAEFNGQYAALNAQRFINPTNKQVLIRLYSTSVGGGFGGDENDGSWIMRYDWVNLTTTNGFGSGNNPSLGGAQ